MNSDSTPRRSTSTAATASSGSGATRSNTTSPSARSTRAPRSRAPTPCASPARAPSTTTARSTSKKACAARSSCTDAAALPVPQPQRRPGPADAFLDGKRRERIGEPAPVGCTQLEVELERGNQHEAAVEQLGVRERHALVLELLGSEQQDVDVDRPRTVTRSGLLAPEIALQALDGREQLQRLEQGAD